MKIINYFPDRLGSKFKVSLLIIFKYPPYRSIQTFFLSQMCLDIAYAGTMCSKLSLFNKTKKIWPQPSRQQPDRIKNY